MRRSLEFHDSNVIGFECAPDGLQIHVDAYIHQWERVDDAWQGTGHVQPVFLTLSGAATPATRNLPLRISDGALFVDGSRDDGLIDLPFTAAGRIRLELVFDDGSRLESTGDHVAIKPSGEARFIEDLPAEFAPDK